MIPGSTPIASAGAMNMIAALLEQRAGQQVEQEVAEVITRGLVRLRRARGLVDPRDSICRVVQGE